MKPFIYHFGNSGVFMWNVDSSVGKNADNNSQTDVSYIQWYYTLAAMNPDTDPSRLALYKQVQITGSCSGTDDDPLVAALLAHQAAIHHPIVDGKVSVETGDGKVGSSAFFVIRLGARIARMYPALWPRLDLMPNCPNLVSKASLAAIPKY